MDKALLGLAVGLYLFLSVAYWLVVPLGESPDEPGHLQCIEQVVRYGRVPIIDPLPEGEWWLPGVTRSGRMCYHMPLYYLLAGQLQKGAAWITGTPLYIEFPPYNPEFSRTGVMFQHAPSARLLHTTEPPVLLILRVLSVLLGTVTLYAGYKTAVRVFPERPMAPVTATALLAGWPQFVFLSRAVSNDVLATALASGLLVVLLGVGNPRRLPWAALLSAAAVAAKFSMLFTVAVVLIAFLLEMWNFPEKRTSYRRALLRSGLIWLVALGILLGHPTTRQHLAGASLYWTQHADRTLGISYWWDVFILLLSSGWGRFGWMNIIVPVWQAYLWWSLIGLTAVVGAIYAWRSSHHRAEFVRLGIFLFWVVGIFASVVRINMVLFQPQFRFALASLPLLAAFSAGGIARLSPDLRWAQWVPAAVILVGMLAINLWIVTTILQTTYG